jgi:hypothetical protein
MNYILRSNVADNIITFQINNKITLEKYKEKFSITDEYLTIHRIIQYKNNNNKNPSNTIFKFTTNLESVSINIIRNDEITPIDCTIKLPIINNSTDEIINSKISKLFNDINIIKQEIYAINYINFNDLDTIEKCSNAVRQNGFILEYIHDEFKTKEVCIEAILSNKVVLHLIPSEIIDIEICQIAIRINAENCKFIPKNMMTQNLCDNIFNYIYTSMHYSHINNKLHIIKYIPEEYITQEYINKLWTHVGNCGAYDSSYTSYKSSKKYISFILHVPKKYITDEITKDYIDKLQKNPEYKYIYYYLPELNYDKYYQLVDSNCTLLEIVPHKFITEELCKLVIDKSPHNIMHVPYNLITLELCTYALKNDTHRVSLQYMPQKFKNMM